MPVIYCCFVRVKHRASHLTKSNYAYYSLGNGRQYDDIKPPFLRRHEPIVYFAVMKVGDDSDLDAELDEQLILKKSPTVHS